jgi:hypothetical protein
MHKHMACMPSTSIRLHHPSRPTSITPTPGILKPMRRIWLLSLLVLLAGCVDKARTPVMGHWTGGFYTDSAEVLRGYIQLYRTGDKFKMRLASKDQEMNFEGTWTIAKRRVELRIADIKFDNPPAETQKAMRLRIFTSEQVRDAYAKPITLDLSSDETELKGLTITLGGIQGRHGFTKGAVTANSQKALDNMKDKR